MMLEEAKTVFIGHDGRGSDDSEVCMRSLLSNATESVAVRMLAEPALRHAGLFQRKWEIKHGIRTDVIDGRPFSTDFAFTRFLVPALMMYQGIALFCDGDFLWRDDIHSLFALFNPRYAVQVVQHAPFPDKTETKMDGQVQSPYFRKNWSSLVLWNCGHPSNRYLTPRAVNGSSGQWLHAFGWLDGDEIGALPPTWNHLIGVNDPDPDPAAAHFTLGTPPMPGRENSPFADEWRSYLTR